MVRWEAVTEAEPDLAAKVQARFEAHGMGTIATLRRDGSPRISGIEMAFGAGELWLGMMPNSVKAKDLLRDPRFALHSASADKNVKAGDAKIAGLAVPVTDEPTFRTYDEAMGGTPFEPGTFHLFRVDVKEISHLIPAGDHLDIEWWTESDGYRTTDRY